MSKLVHADMVDLARLLQVAQVQRGIDDAGHVVVPPVELHQIEPLDAEPLQRAVDDPLDVARGERGQRVEVGDALGVHANRRRVAAARLRDARRNSPISSSTPV